MREADLFELGCLAALIAALVSQLLAGYHGFWVGFQTAVVLVWAWRFVLDHVVRGQ